MKLGNKLSVNRTKDLIQKFLNEANKSNLPIKYSHISIRTFLQSICLNTAHLVKTLNLENCYKGYINFDCPHLCVNNFLTQKFQLVGGTNLPAYQCVIAPPDCHNDNDCHYHFLAWCSCAGDIHALDIIVNLTTVLMV